MKRMMKANLVAALLALALAAWLTAYRCPDHARGTSEATRKFVDQILIPAKEK